MNSHLLSPKIFSIITVFQEFVFLTFYVSARVLAGQSYAATWKQQPELHVTMVLIVLHLMVGMSHKISHLSWHYDFIIDN
jgi:hypothetical protein